MEKIRSFISLDINNEVKKEIEYYIKKNNLIDIFEGAKWVDLENIHLTLAFWVILIKILFHYLKI